MVTPLEVWVGVYQERWAGGELGRVSATDQDPYDSLEFALAPPTPPRLFTIDPRGGALAAAPGLDTGRYLLNVTVSDGKFTSSASVVVLVQPIWDDMLQHSVSIRSVNLRYSPKGIQNNLKLELSTFVNTFAALNCVLEKILHSNSI